MTNPGAAAAAFSLILLALSAPPASADFGMFGGAGYDSNVNRAVDDGTDDFYLTVHAAVGRRATGERQIDWTASASVEGSAYLDIDDLSNVAATLEPGVVFFLRHWLSAGVYPFAHGKAVVDGDQSALAFGGRIEVSERLSKRVSLREYYAYTDSRARVDTYSYTEHAAGIAAVVAWTRRLSTDLGYEYARGDSFRTLAGGSPIPSGPGRRRSFSSAFGTEVIQERVDRHTVAGSCEVGLGRGYHARVAYSYAREEGDLGTTTIHSALAGIGRRF